MYLHVPSFERKNSFDIVCKISKMIWDHQDRFFLNEKKNNVKYLCLWYMYFKGPKMGRNLYSVPSTIVIKFQKDRSNRRRNILSTENYNSRSVFMSLWCTFWYTDYLFYVLVVYVLAGTLTSLNMKLKVPVINNLLLNHLLF